MKESYYHPWIHNNLNWMMLS